MKNLKLKALTAAALMGGSLLATGGVFASVNGGGEAGDTGTAPGAACEAYSPSNDTKLVSDWSTVKAVGSAVWVHCPLTILGAGAAAADFSTTSTVDFNLEMPVGISSTVYNCYVAQQSLVAGSSTKKVHWKAASGVGPTTATLGGTAVSNDLDATFDPTGANTYPANNSYTSGCLLQPGHQLHSVDVLH